jgi:hypothetical protein
MKKQHLVAGLVVANLLYIGFYYFKALFTDHLFYLQFREWRFDVYMIAWLFAIGGLVQFIASGWKTSRLLQIWLFFSQVGHFGFLLMATFVFPLVKTDYFPRWTLLPSVLLVIMTYYCLIVLNRSRTAVIEEIPAAQPGRENIFVFHEANRWVRLANRLLDFGLLLFILIQYWLALDWVFSLKLYNAAHWPQLRFLLEALFFVYYLLLEGIVGTSFGKLITNTVVVNESGRRPTIGQTIGRTFCRLIPFDGWSFLFRQRGWHDTLSGTYVTKGKFDPM